VPVRPAEGTAVFASNRFTPFVERDVSVSELTALPSHNEMSADLTERHVTMA
jgi:hypothetical protein